MKGDVISIDGSTGRVVLGEAELGAAEAPPEFDVILGWADKIRKGAPGGAGQRRQRARRRQRPQLRGRGHRPVPDRAHVPRRGPPAHRAAHDPGRHARRRRAAALEELREAQKRDFIEILEAMDGLPVTVRLLDPPLHEFLPSTEELEIKKATVGADRRGGEAVGRGPGLARGQPDARHPWGPPRGDQARACTPCRFGP
jgi:pyruvate,orthophosphate dikinase